MRDLPKDIANWPFPLILAWLRVHGHEDVASKLLGDVKKTLPEMAVILEKTRTTLFSAADTNNVKILRIISVEGGTAKIFDVDFGQWVFPLPNIAKMVMQYAKSDVDVDVAIKRERIGNTWRYSIVEDRVVRKEEK